GPRGNSTGKRSVEAVNLRARDDLGTDRATRRFTTGERRVHAAGPGVRLLINHPLQRLSLGGEHVGEYDDRRACDGTAIQLQSVSSAGPDPYLGGHACDVCSTFSGFGPLDSQVLRDAQQRVRVRRRIRGEARLGSEAGRLLLPGRARETYGERRAAVRRGEPKPRWGGNPV